MAPMIFHQMMIVLRLLKSLTSQYLFLSNATQFLTKELLDNVLALMYSAKTLHFLGKVAPRLWLLIVSINSFDQLSVQLHFDYHMQLSFVTKLTSEDCVFIFSHSGKTKESINLARQVKNQRKNDYVNW